MMNTMAIRMRASKGARPRLPLMGLRERRGDHVPARGVSIVDFSARSPGLPGATGIEDQVIVAVLLMTMVSVRSMECSLACLCDEGFLVVALIESVEMSLQVNRQSH